MNAKHAQLEYEAKILKILQGGSMKKKNMIDFSDFHRRHFEITLVWPRRRFQYNDHGFTRSKFS